MTHDDRPRTTTDIVGYRSALMTALRLNDVPSERIGEIVAEVESHVADTGEDPVEAFGPAREYAASLTAEHRRPPRWQTAATIACGALAGWFLAQGVLALLLAERYLGAEGWVWVLVGLVVAIPGVLQVRRRSRLVRDPRTGAELGPTPRWAPVTLVAIPIGIVLVAYTAIRLLSGDPS